MLGDDVMTPQFFINMTILRNRILYLIYRKKKCQKECRKRLKILLLQRLAESTRTRNKFNSSGLNPNAHQNWQDLWRNADDEALVSATGLNRAGIETIFMDSVEVFLRGLTREILTGYHQLECYCLYCTFTGLRWS
jgi:hypothetical protein